MKSKLPKITENDVKKSIRRMLQALGIWNFHLLAGLGSYPGLPDRIAVYKGVIWAIEVKKPGGKQSDKQKRFQSLWEYHYAKTYILADDTEVVMRAMKL